MKKILLILVVLISFLTGCNYKNDVQLTLEGASKLYSDNYENYEYYHMGLYEDYHVILVHLDHYAPTSNGDSINTSQLYFEFGENKIMHSCPFLGLYVYIEGHDKLYTLNYAYEIGWINDSHIIEIKNKYEKLDETYFSLDFFIPTIIDEFKGNGMIE
jgi:hypothetical protein